MSVQLHGHGLLIVRPEDVRQHVEQVAADLLHQRIEGVWELFAWTETK